LIDLHIARPAEPSEVRELLATSKMLAISRSNDDETKRLAKRDVAATLLDKMSFYNELVPAIVKTAPPPGQRRTA
jgi:hypothetical protein